jgi:hypothetical protein
MGGQQCFQITCYWFYFNFTDEKIGIGNYNNWKFAMEIYSIVLVPVVMAYDCAREEKVRGTVV